MALHQRKSTRIGSLDQCLLGYLVNISVYHIYTLFSTERNVSVVERPPKVREVAGSIPDRIKQKPLNLVVMVSFLGTQDFIVKLFHP